MNSNLICFRFLKMCSQNLEDQGQNATCQNVILKLIIETNKLHQMLISKSIRLIEDFIWMFTLNMVFLIKIREF